MTFLAADQPFPTMIQGEGVVLEQRWRPGIGAVAVLALQPKGTGVDFRFRMTFRACGWGAGKYCRLRRRAMTGLTHDLGMSPIQDKEAVVIEIAHAVDPIVTFHAAGTEMSQMALHKRRIVSSVTIGADTG